MKQSGRIRPDIVGPIKLITATNSWGLNRGNNRRGHLDASHTNSTSLIYYAFTVGGGGNIEVNSVAVLSLVELQFACMNIQTNALNVPSH